MISKLVTPPTEPITLRQAKLNLRLAVTDDDADAYVYENDLLSRLITDAREYAEHYCDQLFGTQTWECYLDAWDTKIVLPKAPVQSITSVTYNGIAFNDFTLGADGAIYILAEDIPDTELQEVDPIKITYTAGFPATPSAVLTAMHLLIGHMYNHKDAVVQGGSLSILPMGVNAKLDTVRRYI